MFFIKIYIKESYMNYYHTSIQMCGQYCILAPILILSSFVMTLENIIFVCKCLVQCDLLKVTETSSWRRAWQQKSAE